MHMPGLPGVPHGGPHHHGHRFMRPNPMVMWFLLVETVYWAGCAACFLFALHRIADGVQLQGRLKALKEIPDAFTDDERVELIHKIKTHALRAC